MPTPLDKALNSKNMFLGFAGAITAAAAWSIWGGDMFPQQPDPSGDPEGWTETELKRWLSAIDAKCEGNEIGIGRTSQGEHEATAEVIADRYGPEVRGQLWKKRCLRIPV